MKDTHRKSFSLIVATQLFISIIGYEKERKYFLPKYFPMIETKIFNCVASK